MLFWNAFAVGFGATLGLEIALGLCHAFRAVLRGKKK